jgi:hypothetical protein
MLTAIHVVLLAIIAGMIYAGYRANLMQNLLRLGSLYFALLAAMGLYKGLSALLEESGDVPAAYLRAGSFLVIWVGVFLLFKPLLLAALQFNPRNMQFTESYDLPGRLLMGTASGVLLAAILALNVVIIPDIEKRYFQHETHPVLHLDRAAVAVALAASNWFAPGSTSSERMLRDMEMQAALCWMQDELEFPSGASTSESERLAQALERFHKRFPGEDADRAAEELVRQLRGAPEELNAS